MIDISKIIGCFVICLVTLFVTFIYEAIILFVIPDMLVPSLKDTNILKKLMNNDFFILVYSGFSVALLTAIIAGLVYLFTNVLPIP